MNQVNNSFDQVGNSSDCSLAVFFVCLFVCLFVCFFLSLYSKSADWVQFLTALPGARETKRRKHKSAKLCDLFSGSRFQDAKRLCTGTGIIVKALI